MVNTNLMHDLHELAKARISCNPIAAYHSCNKYKRHFKTIKKYCLVKFLFFLFTLSTFNSLAQDYQADTSFGNHGKASYLFVAGTNIINRTAITLQPDGKILQGVSIRNEGPDTTTFWGVVRFNANGVADSTFGEAGLAVVTFSTSAILFAITLQADNKIILAGGASAVNNSLMFALARVDINGNLDSTFDGDGKVTVNITSGENYATKVKAGTNKKIVAIGEARYQGVYSDFAIARFNEDGSLDHSFDGDGLKLINFLGADDNANDLVIYPSGKILIAGTAARLTGGTVAALVRLNQDGSFDTAFSGDGKTVSGFGTDNINVSALSVQNDEKILIGGSINSARFIVCRYTNNGLADTTFNSIGYVLFDFSDRPADLEGCTYVGLQADNKILAAGRSGQGSALAMLNANGMLDSLFTGKGKKTIGTPTESAAAQDNNFIMAGDTLIRLNKVFTTLGLETTQLHAVKKANNIIAFNWSTNEAGISYFLLEVSTDSKNFKQVSTIKALKNYGLTNAYSYSDVNPSPGLNFYRLKIIKTDGSVVFTKIIRVEIGDPYLIRMFPNPSSDDLYLMTGNDVEATLKIINVSGQIMRKQKVFLKDSRPYKLGIKELTKGIYRLVVSKPLGSATLGFIKY